MPRLTNDLYYAEHLFLQVVWENYQILYGALSITQQWQIHAFFQPSKVMTYKELIEHRRTIIRQQPSLSHQAGKAHFKIGRIYLAASRYAEGDEEKLLKAMREIVSTVNRQRSKNRSKIQIIAIARPEPDFKLLAKALAEVC
jgi:hypothetical protein